MSSEAPAKLTRTLTIWMMVIAVPGFIVTLVLNAFFLDDYDAYGKCPFLVRQVCTCLPAR